MKFVFFFLILSCSIIAIFQACQSDKRSKNQKTPQYYKSLELKAYQLLKAGRYHSAIDIYDSLIKNDSPRAEYYYNRAYCYFSIPNNRLAQEDYLESARQGFKVADCYFSVALLNLYSNDSICIVYVKKALEFSPQNKDYNETYNEAVQHLKKIKSSE